ncbi:threonine ammonia-lyase IlvA [uncultured Chryseobacterium sp.]|uniref:threonine ammonia-lyase IlvA n=2 Tax=uncultured Chryseobacterium sp. TaxID=259322 RepID=UPI0025FAB4BA|nr:threonine ammonia-lyase IlvA [uncultured Chryseobacterium sp.]
MKTKENQHRLTIDAINKARKNIAGIVVTTPLQENFRLSRSLKAKILLKREDLQPVRSYKLRGAYHKIKTLFDQGKTDGGVVCASAGNHAQGVALACYELKINGVIFMPVTTPKQKLEQVKMFGGEYVSLQLTGDTFDESKQAAIEYSGQNSTVFIHPFDDPQIIEGQATLAMEILEQSDTKIDYLFAPVGGGGLISGIVSVFSLLSPHTKIIAVEPKGAASMKAALAAGTNVELPFIDKFVDGAAVQKVGDLPFEICKDSLSGCITVDEGKVCDTILEMYNKDAVVLEPAGALSLSALEQYTAELEGKTVVCIISGSNNDITRMEEIKERAMLYKGIKHYFLVKFPQRPGSLKEFVLNVLGADDDIAFFEYTKRNSRETALATVGIELARSSDFEGLKQRMQDQGYFEAYLNSSPQVLNLLI